MEQAEIAVIGGTGMYSPGLVKNAHEVVIDTPFGKPSGPITVGEFAGRKVAFLFRHGPKHTIPPHRINFRANMHALKQLGVKRIIASSAVGSLQEKYTPGDIVIPDQFIDWGGQLHTFYHGGEDSASDGVFHVSMAEPFCSELREALVRACKKLGVRFHETGTYLKIDGPQFSTRAASKMYSLFADLIGMTCVPEAILARELGICFAVIATVTDYDAWAESPVSTSDIKEIMKNNAEKTMKLVELAVSEIRGEVGCRCKNALDDAKI